MEAHLILGKEKMIEKSYYNPTVADPVIPLIEAARARLLKNEKLVRDIPGTPGPFDDQPIEKAARGSKNKENCLHLYLMAKENATGGVVELGTNLGISSAYLAAGARTASPTSTVVTGDCSGKRLAIAQSLHRECGLSNLSYVEGFFDVTAQKIFDLVPSWTLAFIDGDHTFTGTMKYYSIAKRTARPGCVVIFDDIEWSEEMREAWTAIRILHQHTQEIGGMGYLKL